MSKIVLDEFPKEPKECPFCEVHYENWIDKKDPYYLCHLNESSDFDCNFALGKCKGCEICYKITSLERIQKCK